MEQNQKSIIDRIVYEKGSQAIPRLIEVLRTTDDVEALSIVKDTLIRFGIESKRYLQEFLREYREIEEDTPKLEAQYRPILPVAGLLTAIETLGEIGNTKDIPFLYSLLQLFEEEKLQLFIFEAISRLGGGEELLPLLEYLLFEDEDRLELRSHLIMIFSCIHCFRALQIMARLYALTGLDAEAKELVELAVMNLLKGDPDWMEKIRTEPQAIALLDKIVQIVSEAEG